MWDIFKVSLMGADLMWCGRRIHNRGYNGKTAKETWGALGLTMSVGVEVGASPWNFTFTQEERQDHLKHLKNLKISTKNESVKRITLAFIHIFGKMFKVEIPEVVRGRKFCQRSRRKKSFRLKNCFMVNKLSHLQSSLSNSQTKGR